MSPKRVALAFSTVIVTVYSLVASSSSPIGRDDLEIGIAAIEVEAAQRLLVGAQAVLVIDVVAQQERQERRALGRDHVRQAAVAEGVVADEIDRGDLGAAAFVDLEDDVDAVLAEIDDLRA